MITSEQLVKGFEGVYGSKNDLRLFFSPGRVNIIGEHIDYSGGFVFPCAIDLGTYLAIRKREDSILLGFSENFREQGVIELDLFDTSFDSSRGWMNYAVGIFDTFRKMGYILEHGFEFYVEGDIPNGAGLSSSASIELAVAYALNEFYGFNLSIIELVKISQRSENEYNGVKCGIMDQFAVGMGKEDHAILLDCNSLDYKYTPFNLEDKSIVIINSNKKRTLVDSKYNERRASCEEAFSMFKEHLDIGSLCEVTQGQYEELKKHILSEETRKRAKHAIYENQRVQKAVNALTENNLTELAKLMKESHLSLRDDYEVSVFELDKLAELAWEFEGVWGARMTGAGFGGCTVNIVENGKIDGFIQYVSAKYLKATGIEADFYITKVSSGVHEIK